MYDQLNQQLDLAKLASSKAGPDAYEIPEQEAFFESLKKQLAVVASHFHKQAIGAIRAWRALQQQQQGEGGAASKGKEVMPSGGSVTTGGNQPSISHIRVVTSVRQAWQVGFFFVVV